MFTIENIATCGWEAAIRGMRNPYNSWGYSDSDILSAGNPYIGPKDKTLMGKLMDQGDADCKFIRMINASMDIIAPLYWWKQFDTYKVGTVADSCSTMHTITARDFKPEDFSYDQNGILDGYMPYTIRFLNDLRYQYIHEDRDSKKKEIWLAIIQALPECYDQRRTVQCSYQALRNMYRQRKDHKLPEWRQFRYLIADGLPYADLLITRGVDNNGKT